METVKTLPKASPTHFVVKPILKEKMQVAGIDLEFINMADDQSNRATEGVVEVVPEYVELDMLEMMRMGYSEEEARRKEKIKIKGELLGIEIGDIVGFHFNQVDTLELSSDDYLIIHGSSVIYARNEKGLKPTHGAVILERLKMPDRTESGIYYPYDRFYEDRYKIIATPPTFNDAKPGDEVMVAKAKKRPLVIQTYIDGVEYVRAWQNNIVAIYE